jgi:hypothetical protein
MKTEIDFGGNTTSSRSILIIIGRRWEGIASEIYPHPWLLISSARGRRQKAEGRSFTPTASTRQEAEAKKNMQFK